MKLIILDRDGVINHESPNYIKSPDEWAAIPGSLEAIVKLNQAGYTVAVATNQSGVGRGLYTEAALKAIHEKMQTELKKIGGHVDKIVYCPHTPEEHCDCRKPNTGLFEMIAKEYNVSLKNVPAIGDSLRDIQAAKKMGCQAILVRTGNGEAVIAQNKELEDVAIFPDLLAAIDALLKHAK